MTDIQPEPTPVAPAPPVTPAQRKVARSIGNFQASTQGEQTYVSWTWTLHHKDTGEETVHEYRALEQAEAAATLTLGSLVQYAPDGAARYNMPAMLGFFHAVMDDDDYNTLIADIEDKTWRVSFDTVSTTFQALVEAIAGRPTQPSSGSPSEQRATGAPSTAVASWRD